MSDGKFAACPQIRRQISHLADSNTTNITADCSITAKMATTTSTGLPDRNRRMQERRPKANAAIKIQKVTKAGFARLLFMNFQSAIAPTTKLANSRTKCGTHLARLVWSARVDVKTGGTCCIGNAD
jgi:hypothetical protein